MSAPDPGTARTDGGRSGGAGDGDDWTAGRPAIVVHVCGRCGQRWYLPHRVCPACASGDISSFDAGGPGRVAAVTVVHRRADGGPPVGIALVDLAEGVRIMARCDPATAVGTATLIGFAPAGGGDPTLLPTCEALP